ncbi:MAG: PLP-dependent aminotransferase family protein, partial [Pseudomonadota bacterium]
DSPLYRQLFEKIKGSIQFGDLQPGERLPATRELAGQLGLNRTTVSAAYELLETEGLIEGHVGRGSFVSGGASREAHSREGPSRVNWENLLPPLSLGAQALPLSRDGISFAASRPSEQLFPLDEFRAACREAIAASDASSILQLGSAHGYPPLRRYLLNEARRHGIAGSGDDLVVTNGCQQALDLIQRVLVPAGENVVVEDPVYPGLKNVFLRAGVRVIGVPVGPNGIDVEKLGRVLAKERPRLLIITSDFQNPTGATLPLAARRAILRLAREAGVVVVENDIYGALRYQGEALPALKRLDESGGTVLLESFSKIAFPGLRVGWVVGPSPFMARLAEAKQSCDLHTGQLSQAVLLRFAQSGRLEAHRQKMLATGAERLAAALDACRRYLPPGTRFTRPQGGMNLWVRLPE